MPPQHSAALEQLEPDAKQHLPEPPSLTEQDPCPAQQSLSRPQGPARLEQHRPAAQCGNIGKTEQQSESERHGWPGLEQVHVPASHAPQQSEAP
jgi:hypothetical protein